MQSRIYKVGWRVLDALFPPTCAGCGMWGEKYCPACFAKTTLIGDPICQLCGDRLFDNQFVICDRCSTTEISFSAVRSWAFFEDPIKTAIHKLKYKRDIGLGITLAEPLIELKKRLAWQIDVVIPIPLASRREKDRGYNQSNLIARPLAWEIRAAYLPKAVSRIKDTRQQVGLNRKERQENMLGAFSTSVRMVANKRVLLVDDVITTGSTMNACARSLMDGGAAAVYGLTLARSVYL